MSEEVLRIENLTLTLPAPAARPVLDGVSIVVHRGETVGLVGESGSGKSVTSRTALGMVPRRAAVTGRVLVNGVDVLSLDTAALRRLRSHQVAMVFQDARSGVNPVRKIKDFLVEGLIASGSTRDVATTRCTDLLDAVGIRDPQRVLESYPHQLSGGMLQRIMISAALAPDPALLLADEPTTALDVTTQAEVVSILDRRRAETGAAMLFVTHNLDLAATICDRIYVMYAGRIVETGSTEKIFSSPVHPYTRALVDATPQLDGARGIRAIPGRSLSLADPVHGCPFATRCPIAIDACSTETPPLRQVDGRDVACIRAEETVHA